MVSTEHSEEDIDIMLIDAFKNKDYDLAQKLYDCGADIDVECGEILENAICENDLSKVKKICEYDVNIYSKHIIAACKTQNIELIKYLYETCKGNFSITKYFIKYRNLDIIKILFCYATDLEKNKALVLASHYQNYDAVKYLCEQGADPSYDNGASLSRAITNNHFNIFKYLYQHCRDIYINNNLNNLLIDACDNDCYKISKYLCENGADINIDNGIVLQTAVYLNKLDFVKYLVENNVDIFARDKYTALDQACIGGDLHIVKYLCEHNANVNDYGDRAVNNAARKGNIDIVAYLVDLGANISGYKNKAMANACLEGNINMVKYLIENDENVHINIDIITKLITGNFCKIIEYLYEMDMCNNININTLFIHAIGRNRWTIAKYFAINGADYRSFINVAHIISMIQNMDYNFFIYLYEMGACNSISNDALLEYAIRFKNLKITKYLIECDTLLDKHKALYISRTYGFLDGVKYLREVGAVDTTS